MTNGLDEFRELGLDAIDYLRLRWASFRLAVVDTLSRAAAKTAGIVLALVFLFSALAFFAIALALWIGEMMGRPSIGFVIVGGVFLLIGVLMWFLGRRIFTNGMIHPFIDMFFTDYDYRHDSRD
jgi:hypothetical protein